MNPLVILLIGMAIVIGGILALRLHAFLALAAGALTVALLTPTLNIQRFSLRDAAIPILSSNGPLLTLEPNLAQPLNSTLLLMRANSTTYTPIAVVQLLAHDDHATRALVLAPDATGDRSFSLLPNDLLLPPAAADDALKSSHQSIGERVADGFGKTARDIGILLAMASILGKTLVDSGAAESIVIFFRRALGERRVALAFLIAAFSLAGLVLADTTFYMLIPLAQTMAARTGKDYTLYILAIVAGATMTHSLVPPAPGPVIIATELHVPLFHMILGGLAIGAIASAAGYLYARWANLRWHIPVRAGLAGPLPTPTLTALPPLPIALAPIALPLLLIAARALAESSRWPLPPQLLSLLKTLGEKNLALTLAAALGLLLVHLRRKQLPSAPSSRDAVAHGLSSGGVMVLIISAGGAFGLVLRQTDIGETIRNLLPVSKLALIPLAFLVTTALRTAQGSATVAIITAAGIVAPIAAAGDLGYNPLYLALAIGCGSKPGMWMNDAGFWILTKTSGFTEAETLKTATVLMTIMGLTGLAATTLAALLLPLAQHLPH